MESKNFNNKDLLIAVLLVLPSFAFVPLYLYLLLVPLMITRNTKLDFNFYLIVLIVLLCLINQILNLKVLLRDFSYSDMIPYTVFIMISYLFGKNVNARVFHYLLLFISFEIFIGVLEYMSGVKSFFPAVLNKIVGEAPFGFNGLIYYKRVAGLSANSSGFAFKVFVGILLLHYLKIKGRKLYIYAIIFAVGLLITFTRSVILAVLFFLVLANIPRISRFVKDLLNKKLRIIYILLGVGLFVLVFLVLSNWEDLYFQLNRGMEDVDMSERDIVLQRYYNFLEEHIYFGNGSYKLWVNINGVLYHGHNSFLQTFATHGIFIGLIFLYLVFRNMNKYNFYYLLSFLVLSLFQYVIFWGVSFMDLIFFYFLFITKDSLIKEKLLTDETIGKVSKRNDLKKINRKQIEEGQIIRKV